MGLSSMRGAQATGAHVRSRAPRQPIQQRASNMYTAVHRSKQMGAPRRRTIENWENRKIRRPIRRRQSARWIHDARWSCHLPFTTVLKQYFLLDMEIDSKCEFPDPRSTDPNYLFKCCASIRVQLIVVGPIDGNCFGITRGLSNRR